MENYEKKYRDALDTAKDWLACSSHSHKEETLLKSIFPELNENSEETIKAFIRGLLLPHITDSHIIGDKIVFNKDIDKYRKALSWLDSCGKYNHWKPSATDVKVLEEIIDSRVKPLNYHATLHGILEQLKKLRGE